MKFQSATNEAHWIKDALRFVFAGMVNTGFTFITFLLAAAVMRYEYAYSLSWIAGIAFVLVFYPSKVFAGSKSSPKKLAIVFVQYGIIFLIGLLWIRLLVEIVKINQQIAIIITIMITTIMNFLLMRFVFRKINI